jgi:transcriptional regulator with XRE-family HTH domain
MYELDERTTAAAMRSPSSLLHQLSREYGLSWATIARLAGVTATAVRKWRRGETVSAENRRSIARAVTFLEMLTQNAGPLEDMGSWLEMPLSDAATVTPLDLYAAGEFTALLEHAGGHLRAHAMLDQFDPDWREHYARDVAFEVVEAEDGHLSITERASAE